MIKEIGIILSRTPYGTDSVILNILSASGINSGIRKGVSQNKKNVHPAETQVGAIVEYVLSP
ncbi:MAG: recombination protein O N-terminal domain-containing protein, partial [Flavobacteriales bacterium]|nr:recombination protein O N-terminal domain-containing protein [Flavobacteriales bacterium]